MVFGVWEIATPNIADEHWGVAQIRPQILQGKLWRQKCPASQGAWEHFCSPAMHGNLKMLRIWDWQNANGCKGLCFRIAVDYDNGKPAGMLGQQAKRSGN